MQQKINKIKKETDRQTHKKRERQRKSMPSHTKGHALITVHSVPWQKWQKIAPWVEVHDQVEVDGVLESKVQLGQPWTAAVCHNVTLLLKERNLKPPPPPVVNKQTVTTAPRQQIIYSWVVNSALSSNTADPKTKLKPGRKIKPHKILCEKRGTFTWKYEKAHYRKPGVCSSGYFFHHGCSHLVGLSLGVS